MKTQNNQRHIKDQSKSQLQKSDQDTFGQEGRFVGCVTQVELFLSNLRVSRPVCTIQSCLVPQSVIREKCPLCDLVQC